MSWQHRLYIWDFTQGIIMKAPIFGYGMEASRHFPLPKTFLTFYQNKEPLSPQAESLLPLHPHNAFLQLWLELGSIGVLMFFFLGVWFVFCMERRTNSIPMRALLGASFSATMVPSFVSFGLWQSWWMSTQIVLILTWVMVLSLKKEDLIQ